MLDINIDSHEAYTEAEVRQSCADEMAQIAADGNAAQASTYEQWLEEQRDLGLLVVDIDDYCSPGAAGPPTSTHLLEAGMGYRFQE